MSRWGDSLETRTLMAWAEMNGGGGVLQFPCVNRTWPLLSVAMAPDYPCLEHSTSYRVSVHEWDQDRDYFDSRPWHIMMVFVKLNDSFLRNGLFLTLFLHFLNLTLLESSAPLRGASF